MGRAARLQTARTCPHCEGVLYATAAELQAHTLLCLRAKAAGLVLPTLQRPTLATHVQGVGT